MKPRQHCESGGCLKDAPQIPLGCFSLDAPKDTPKMPQKCLKVAFCHACLGFSDVSKAPFGRFSEGFRKVFGRRSEGF